MGASIFFKSTLLWPRALNRAIIALCFFVSLSPPSIENIIFFQDIAHEAACPEAETQTNTGTSESIPGSPDEVHFFCSHRQKMAASRVALKTKFSQGTNVGAQSKQLSLLRKPQIKSSNAFSPSSPSTSRRLPLIV